VTLSLFQGYGIEVERMIVHESDLAPYPVGDRVLSAAGAFRGEEVDRGETRWSNELVLHVIELKTNGPRPSLDGLAAAFARDEDEMDRLLAPHDGRILPTSMHPFLNPLTDARLWPHEHNEVYRTYDRAFGCKNHGFSNLQSVHVNLPFSGDREFARLHAAVRLVLPLLPALAASSPLVEGQLTGTVDNRLVAYRRNQRLVPEITGSVIPERIRTKAEYQDRILRRIDRAVARLDTEGVLEAEWVNSRGAITRFSRSAIEIRVIDAQESADADVAVAAAAIALVKALVEERWSSFEDQFVIHESHLLPFFLRAVEAGGDAVIDDARFLACFGAGPKPLTMRVLWGHLIDALDVRVDGGRTPLDVIVRQGTLSERIARAVGPEPSRDAIVRIYRHIAECRRTRTSFLP
jgi:gamma-glutamyl:cysteine ligase YbdK (ATP-grasp superfamily)